LKYSKASLFTIDEFQIEYLIPTGSAIAGQYETLQFEGLDFVHVRIEKNSNQTPIFYQVVSGQAEPMDSNPELLPTRIVGYSSGQNELLSIPFKKICFKYYDSLRKEHKRTLFRQYIPPPRLNYMDYENHAVILVANYLINSPPALDIFKHRIGIEDIFAFDMYIRTNFRRHDA